MGVHNTRSSSVSLTLALAAVVGLGSGCTSYTSVDEACHEKVPSQGALSTDEQIGGFNRLNCHRRVMNLSRARPQRQVQTTVENQLTYLRNHPRRELITASAAEWTSQSSIEPDFTGATVFERVLNEGYSFPTITTWGVFEFSAVLWDDDILPVEAVVDELMRSQDFRQLGLQGSWVDGGFSTIDVGQDWFRGIEFDTLIGELPEKGRLYQWVVFYDLPHFEQVDRPRTYPKDGQVNVPRYEWTVDPGDPGGLPTIAQIGYPITITSGTVTPDNVNLNNQNLYELRVNSASLQGPDGLPVDIFMVQPGSSVNDRFPSGSFLRSMVNIYTYEPMLANTQYRLYADVTTMDGEFDIDTTFTTGEDTDVIEGTWDGQLAYADGTGTLGTQAPPPTTTTTTTPGGGGGGTGNGYGYGYGSGYGTTSGGGVGTGFVKGAPQTISKRIPLGDKGFILMNHTPARPDASQ